MTKMVEHKLKKRAHSHLPLILLLILSLNREILLETETMFLQESFHSDVEIAYKASIEYLKNHPDLDGTLDQAIWAYEELGDLVPQTLEKFGSGHYFPHSESEYELQTSLGLCLEGIYRQSFVVLRSVLELGIFGVYLDIQDNSHLAVKPWIKSEIRTPSPRKMMNSLVEIPYFTKFDHRFGLRDEVKTVFEKLGSLVHIKGYKYSSSAYNRSNTPQFQERSLRKYCETMFEVVRLISIITLLKYPIGIVSLPIDEKFGMNGPVGGFLQEYQVNKIQSLLKEEERYFLQESAKNDRNIQSIVSQFNSLPDISEEEFRVQMAEWDKFLEENKAKIPVENA